MSPKNIVRAILLLIVTGSLVYMMFGERQQPEETVAAADSNSDAEVLVYFFYNDLRCESCLRIEQYAKETLDTHFAEELATGVIAWQSLSMDAPENKHYLTEFELFSKSIVLVDLQDGEQVRWNNLEKIWDLVYDKPAYIEYVRMSIQDFLRTPS